MATTRFDTEQGISRYTEAGILPQEARPDAIRTALEQVRRPNVVAVRTPTEHEIQAAMHQITSEVGGLTHRQRRSMKDQIKQKTRHT